jgi:hypothetical protein
VGGWAVRVVCAVVTSETKQHGMMCFACTKPSNGHTPYVKLGMRVFMQGLGQPKLKMVTEANIGEWYIYGYMALSIIQSKRIVVLLGFNDDAFVGSCYHAHLHSRGL